MELDRTFIADTRLRELMDANKHTQLTLALEAKISDRTIRRALNGKPVDRTSIEKLANALKCSPEALLDKEPTIWVLSKEGKFDDLRGLSFKADLFDVFELIQEDVDLYNKGLESDALAIAVHESKEQINVEAQSKRSSFTVSWTFRPAILTESGLIYSKINGWDEFMWDDYKYDLFRRLGDDVTLNAKELFSKVVKPGWHVLFGIPSKFSEREFVGEQHFSDDASFRNSINQHLRTVQVLRAKKTNAAEIRLEYENKDKLRQLIIIRRANFGPGGAIFHASLHKALADRIVAGLTSFSPGRIDCLAGHACDDVPFGPCEKSVSTY